MFRFLSWKGKGILFCSTDFLRSSINPSQNGLVVVSTASKVWILDLCHSKPCSLQFISSIYTKNTRRKSFLLKISLVVMSNELETLVGFELT